MWLVRFFIGLLGIGYFLKNGVFNSNRSNLERFTYAWLALPLVLAAILFCIILIMIPIVFIGVALEDCPVIGVFLLVGIGLFIANVVKNVTDKKEEKEYDPAQGAFAQFVKNCKEDQDRKEAQKTSLELIAEWREERKKHPFKHWGEK